MPTRMALLENDADGFERLLGEKLDERFDRMDRRQRWITGVGVSILISLISALAVVAFK